MLGLGVLGWLALLWGANKIFGGGDKAKSATITPSGEARPADSAELAPIEPKAGDTAAGKRDGEFFRRKDGEVVFVCNEMWWTAVEGGVCCEGASGTAITLIMGKQVVCAYDDFLASYRWKKVPD